MRAPVVLCWRGPLPAVAHVCQVPEGRRRLQGWRSVETCCSVRTPVGLAGRLTTAVASPLPAPHVVVRGRLHLRGTASLCGGSRFSCRGKHARGVRRLTEVLHGCSLHSAEKAIAQMQVGCSTDTANDLMRAGGGGGHRVEHHSA